jgi:hypothetical protein
MDVLTIIEKLNEFFSSMNSFDVDPDNEGSLLDVKDNYILKTSVVRALRWMKDKIYQSDIEPIEVTLDNMGDSQEAIM